MIRKFSIPLSLAVIVLLIATIGFLYSYYVDPIFFPSPTANIPSVRKILNNEKTAGLAISRNIRKYFASDSYPDQVDKNVIGKWKYIKVNADEYKLEKKLFNNSRLVLVCLNEKSIIYSWEYYSGNNSKVEYLYVAP